MTGDLWDLASVWKVVRDQSAGTMRNWLSDHDPVLFRQCYEELLGQGAGRGRLGGGAVITAIAVLFWIVVVWLIVRHVVRTFRKARR